MVRKKFSCTIANAASYGILCCCIVIRCNYAGKRDASIFDLSPLSRFTHPVKEYNK
jgi:hypothetical protein